MRLTVLGKYGPFPKAGGACSSYLVEDGDTRILLDLGSGAFSRLIGCVDIEKLDAIFISHFHYDHCSDLGVLGYALDKLKANPIRVFSSAKNGSAGSLLWNRVADGDELRVGSLKLRFFKVIHPVDCLGVRLENTEGRTLVYTADTCFFPELVNLAHNADLLLADCCFLEPVGQNDKPAHMAAVEAGELARLAGAKRLILTHIYGGLENENELLTGVGFGGAAIAAEGEVYEVGNGNG